MAKYTPGPWAVSNSGGRVIRGGLVHPGVIAVLETAPLKISDEVVANARLIAAAPDLLTALERLLEHTGGCDFRENANDEITGPCLGLADPMYGTECPSCEAHTAIAKAKDV